MSERDQQPHSPYDQPYLAQLRQLMTERLNRTEVGVLWFDLLGSPMDEDLPGCSNSEGVIQLLTRARQRGMTEELVAQFVRTHPHVLAGYQNRSPWLWP